MAIQFGGLADLMDRFHQRLAAAADIPMTRFLAQSPAGMNATGESDLENYYSMVESNRERQLAHNLPILDEVVARDAGLREVPDYEWPSLIETSDKDIAEAALIKVQALREAVDGVLMDEDEARARLDGDDIFGVLSGDAPEPPPEPEPMPDPFGGPPAPPVPPTGD